MPGAVRAAGARRVRRRAPGGGHSNGSVLLLGVCGAALGCDCTLLMLPRPGYEAPERRPFCVALRPGDVYVLRDAARWEWLHGVAVADDVEVARRAVVWRVLVD